MHLFQDSHVRRILGSRGGPEGAPPQIRRGSPCPTHWRRSHHAVSVARRPRECDKTGRPTQTFGHKSPSGPCSAIRNHPYARSPPGRRWEDIHRTTSPRLDPAASVSAASQIVPPSRSVRTPPRGFDTAPHPTPAHVPPTTPRGRLLR